jgi:hypothetical protein
VKSERQSGDGRRLTQVSQNVESFRGAVHTPDSTCAVPRGPCALA